ncbi:uroporphyrinogen-III C-methyltransferase [bacterium]|jgi:uroporphyrinogen III methyltransferase / synthase|nr:uroporphyrinogen-III C-methyltransferase [bacterium]
MLDKHRQFRDEPLIVLVGAGPGDPDLLSVKGKMYLEIADIILYDALVHPTLLSWATSDCILIDVGKRKGAHSKKQNEIHELIAHYYSDSRLIVRLKGGDPMIFGRGGEELDYIRSKNWNVVVVPGISSLTGISSSLGLSLTHRDIARSLTAITGRFKDENVKNPWDIVIPDSDTLVFFMAVTTLNILVERLLVEKKWGDKTPCALIYHGTVSSQKIVVGTLSTIVAEQKREGIKPPAIFIVGEVVASLFYRKDQELFGTRVILFRDKDKSQGWKEFLSLAGVDVVLFPVTSFDSLDVSNSQLDCLFKSSVILFTSQTAVRYFIDLLSKNKLDVRVLAGKKIISVGPSTTQYLSRYGLCPDFEPTVPSIEGVVLEYPEDYKGTVFFPCSEVSDLSIKTSFIDLGVEMSLCPIYKPVYALPSYPVTFNDTDILIFTSPAQADFVLANMKIVDTSVIIAIGQTTYKGLMKRDLKNKIYVADTPCVIGVFKTLLNVKNKEV